MDFEPRTWVLITGFALGLIAGFAARARAFCTLGAIADVVVSNDHRRLRAWALALALALTASQAIHYLGVVDLGQSIYLATPVNIVMALIGGGMFGLGMTLVGTCAFGTLIRLGGGDLKALITMACLGFFAYLTLSGPIAYPRTYMTAATDLGVVELADDLRLALAIPIAATLLYYALKDGRLRQRPGDVAAALAIGAVIPLGWLTTGLLGQDPFEPEPLASLTFVRPIGDGFLYMMLMSGMSATFGVATVAGVLAGALAASGVLGEWRLEGFDGEREMVRHLAGAALMGIGGVLALGCTIGQGMSAMSTLAPAAPFAGLAIVFGASVGLRYLEEGSFKEALRSLVGRRPS